MLLEDIQFNKDFFFIVVQGTMLIEKFGMLGKKEYQRTYH